MPCYCMLDRKNEKEAHPGGVMKGAKMAFWSALGEKTKSIRTRIYRVSTRWFFKESKTSGANPEFNNAISHWIVFRVTAFSA